MNWFVYDRDTDTLYGPFPTKDAAAEYANVLYGDDGSGNTRVVQAVKP